MLGGWLLCLPFFLSTSLKVGRVDGRLEGAAESVIQISNDYCTSNNCCSKSPKGSSMILACLSLESAGIPYSPTLKNAQGRKPFSILLVH